MKTLIALVLLPLTAFAQSITIPAQTACTLIPSHTVCVSLPARTVSVVGGTTPPPPMTCTLPEVLTNGVCGPPAITPPPPTGVTWGYTNGKLSYAGDFTLGGTSVDYHHATDSGLNGHTQDIAFASSGNWGLFLPHFADGNVGYRYPNPGYTKLLISVKPSVTGDTFGLYFVREGDIDTAQNCHVELLKYGPPTVAGKWGSYVIPLADMCVLGDKTLYKFGLQNHAGRATAWEMDDIGFQ